MNGDNLVTQGYPDDDRGSHRSTYGGACIIRPLSAFWQWGAGTQFTWCRRCGQAAYWECLDPLAEGRRRSGARRKGTVGQTCLDGGFHLWTPIRQGDDNPPVG